MDSGSRITDVASVPEDTTFVFTVRERDSGDEREAILVKLDDGEIVGWLNDCQHFTHIPLDKGSGATMRNGEILCENHGAMFEADTGECTYGPCQGAFLDDVAVTVEEDGVYLVDEEFEFLDTGPAETDDLDLSSSSNVEWG